MPHADGDDLSRRELPIPAASPWPPLDSDLARLTAAMCDGTATAADRDRLERLLEEPAARRAYVTLTEIHAGLNWRSGHAGDEWLGDSRRQADVSTHWTHWGKDPSGRGIVGGPRAAFVGLADRARELLNGTAAGLRETVRFILRPTPFSLLVATVVMASGLTLAALLTVRQDVGSSSVRPRGPVVAEFLGFHDVRWREPRRMPDPRLGITAGMRLDLDGGLVEILLSSGARVILEGPAQLDVHDGSTVVLGHGLLHARFSKAIARRAHQADVPTFEVRTPVATFTDLGTEFAAGVSEDGTSVLHVYEGLVELTPRIRDDSFVPPRLGAGSAMQVDERGTIRPAGPELASRVIRRMPGQGPPPEWIAEQAVTLLHERFDAAGPLDGAPATFADHDTVTWRANQGWTADGGQLLAPPSGGAAKVAFVPEHGVVYRLSVIMDVTGGPTGIGWGAVGFLPEQARQFFNGSAPGGYAWMAQRSERSPEHGGNFAAGGPSIAGKIPSIDDRYGRHERMVQLDTRGRRWRARFFVDGDEVAWYVFHDQSPPLTSLGVGASAGVSAAFSNLRLEVYRPAGP